MARLRKSLVVATGAALMQMILTAPASAQIQIDPSATPAQNDSPLGPIHPLGIPISIAGLMAIGALVIAIILVLLYMRYAPRFAKDEESLKVVRADRVVIGQELPRRNVDLSQAAPVLVAPPAVPAALGAGAPAAAPPAVAAPATAAPAPAPEAAPVAPAAPQAASPPPPTPAAAPAVPAPAPAPAERKEVTMDQAVFDATLAELLDAGTDRRIAEGKARRAAMIAAKKAAGEG